uniref:Uncharacterized protein n=1 Tax=Arundo donax TaxID=35708 RepID=A0A0A9E8R1_ARUDO
MKYNGYSDTTNPKSYHKHTSFSSTSVDEWAAGVSFSIFSRKQSTTSRLLSSSLGTVWPFG